MTVTRVQFEGVTRSRSHLPEFPVSARPPVFRSTMTIARTANAHKGRTGNRRTPVRVDENEINGTPVLASTSWGNGASNERENMNMELMAQKYNEIQGQKHVIWSMNNIRKLTNNISGFGEGTSGSREGACR